MTDCNFLIVERRYILKVTTRDFHFFGWFQWPLCKKAVMTQAPAVVKIFAIACQVGRTRHNEWAFIVTYTEVQVKELCIKPAICASERETAWWNVMSWSIYMWLENKISQLYGSNVPWDLIHSFINLYLTRQKNC